MVGVLPEENILFPESAGGVVARITNVDNLLYKCISAPIVVTELG